MERIHHSNDTLMDEAIARLEGIDSGRHRDTAKYKKVLEAIDELHRVSGPFYEKPIGDEDNLWEIRSAYKDLVAACDAYAEGKGDKRRSEFGSQRLESIRAIRDLALKDSALFDTELLEDATSMNVGQLLTKARSITVLIEDAKEITTVGAQTSSRIPLEVDRGNGPKQGFFTESKINDTDDLITQSFIDRYEDSTSLSPLNKVLIHALEESKCETIVGALVGIELKNFPLSEPSENKGVFGRTRGTDVMTKGLEEFREVVSNKIYPVPKEFNSTDSFRKWITSDPSIIPALNEISAEAVSRRLSCKNNHDGGIVDHRDIPIRNVGMSRCAELLGLHGLIAKADSMTIQVGGELKHGVFMEKAEGSDIKHPRPSDPLVTLFHDYNMDLEPFSGSYKRDLANLQVIDYICGNPDRHLANMIYQTGIDENGHLKVTGVVGIDNDLSFGDIAGNNLCFNPSNFRVMTRDTAMMVMSITPAALDIITADMDLAPEEKNEMTVRVRGLQSYLMDPSNIFMYDSSVAPATQLPYANGKLIIVNDEKDLQRIPFESLIVPPNPMATEFSSDRKGNIFYQATGVPGAVRDATHKMFDRAWKQAGKELESCMDDNGEYVDPATKKPGRFEDLINAFNTKILEKIDRFPPIHYAKTVLRGGNRASTLDTTQQAVQQRDTGLAPDQKPLRFTPESVAAAKASQPKSTTQKASQGTQRRDTGLAPDQKPLRFTPESVAAAKASQLKSTSQTMTQGIQWRDTGLAPDQKPLRFTPESVAAAKTSQQKGTSQTAASHTAPAASGPDAHTRTRIDFKTLQSREPKSDAARKRDALAEKRLQRSQAAVSAPQSSMPRKAAGMGK